MYGMRALRGTLGRDGVRTADVETRTMKGKRERRAVSPLHQSRKAQTR